MMMMMFIIITLLISSSWTASAAETDNEVEMEEEVLKQVTVTTEELVDLICSCRENSNSELQQEKIKESLRLTPRPTDCYDIMNMGLNESGRYDIYPFDIEVSEKPIRVWCDMETDGGGWSVFQRREDGSVDFNFDWETYKNGFGFVGGEYWLGNENIHVITNQKVYELRIDLDDWDNEKRFAKYDQFRLGDESTNYKLLLGSYSGTAGDSLGYHRNRAFSTEDADNDAWSGNCVSSRGGPWWYGVCEHSDLNGEYLKASGEKNKGVTWNDFRGLAYSLKRSEMKIRPIARTY